MFLNGNILVKGENAMYGNGDQVRIIGESTVYTVCNSGSSGFCIIQLGNDAGTQRPVKEDTLELVKKHENPKVPPGMTPKNSIF